jgi:starch phosphorylase
MKNQPKTRWGLTSEDIAQDFAEHLKYSQDADIYHRTDHARYTALALAIKDRILTFGLVERKISQKG